MLLDWSIGAIICLLLPLVHIYIQKIQEPTKGKLHISIFVYYIYSARILCYNTCFPDHNHFFYCIYVRFAVYIRKEKKQIVQCVLRCVLL